jgi:hypothetical protein
VGSILDKYLSVIPSVQSQNIKRKVYENALLRGSSDSAARADFNERVAEIVGQPAPNMFKGFMTRPGRRVYSEVFEGIFSDLSNDLSVLFAEYDLLHEAGVSQTSYYQNEIVQKLSKAVKEARTEVKRVGSLNKTFANEFNSLAENFDQGDANRLLASDPIRGSILRDPLNGLVPRVDQELLVDIGSGSLCLPISGQSLSTYLPRNNRGGEEAAFSPSPALAGTTSSDSHWDDLNDLAGIENIKDQDPGSFWEHAVYKEVESNSEVILSLSLLIGGSGANCNYVLVNALADQLIGARAVRLDGSFVDLVDSSSRYSLDALSTVIRFDEIAAKRIDLIFSKTSYIEVREGGTRLYKYPFKVKYIEVGKSTFKQVGYYASRSLRGINQSIFQLNTVDLDKASGVIEYTLHYRDYVNRETVSASKAIPILPVGETESRELLVLLADNTAFLRFFTGTVTVDHREEFPDTVKIYRNGSELLRNVDYVLYNPPLAESKKYEERSMVLFPDHVDINAEFIAEYTPYWTSGNIDPDYTNSLGDVYFRVNNTIEIHRPVESASIRSECNLGITIRATGDKRKGPRVSEYTLSVGEKFSK